MLTIEIYRPVGFPDCTNNGASAREDRLCVVNVNGPNKTVPHDCYPVILELHQPGCLRLVPAQLVPPYSVTTWAKQPNWFMMGGNFGHTSDSRFAEACENLLGHRFYGAVAIHDRVE